MGDHPTINHANRATTTVENCIYEQMLALIGDINNRYTPEMRDRVCDETFIALSVACEPVWSAYE